MADGCRLQWAASGQPVGSQGATMDSTTPATPPARAAWFMSENQSGQLQGYLYNLSKKKEKLVMQSLMPLYRLLAAFCAGQLALLLVC